LILLSHPTGNAFVRAILTGLLEANELDSFHTTINFERRHPFYPQAFNNILSRRQFPVPSDKVVATPARELVRLLAAKFGFGLITRHEVGWASLDAVYRELDQSVSKSLYQRSDKGKQLMPTAIYSYEDACLNSFKAAKYFGMRRFYDLPIAYWETSRRLLQEEAERWPAWEPTLYATRDSQAKLDRKSEELELSEVVICPSKFVMDTLPESVKAKKICLVAEFGTTMPDDTMDQKQNSSHSRQNEGPLRVLFAGSMGQRKGLADLFAAMKMLKRSDVELVVMGSAILPLEFYRGQFSKFQYEQTRSHQEVLQLMRTCHVLVLPSIVEGRALVQQEAMACGLPIIVTANTGGADLIEEGKTGFLIPIRSPDKIAEKISWFADHRNEIAAMGELARKKAMQLTWDSYRQKILSVILPLAEGNTIDS
jgi:glycosyltransferase involved in cell wall biosynthesis